MSQEVGTLGTALLLFGFGNAILLFIENLCILTDSGLGPLVWAPLSEVYGRKPAVLAPYFVAAIFSFGTATAKDLQTIMITRFFAGFFGSAPVTNTGGVLGDIWTAEQRGAAIVGYAMAVVGGPILGPIVGGAVVQSYLGWRWTEYVCRAHSSCWGGACANNRQTVNWHSDDVLPHHGRPLPRRELRPRPPRLQSPSSPFHQRKLGPPRPP